MPTKKFPEKRPVLFSVLVLLVYFIVQAAGVVSATRLGLPLTTFAFYSQIVLTLILIGVTSGLHWWTDIGFRKPKNWASLWLFLPGLALVIGNLTFGIHVTQIPALILFFSLAIASGFTEEVTFRGLILRAFLPRGAWAAVGISTLFFGFAHLANIFAGSNPAYALLQVAYALAIGFAFGAMALHGRMLWPLILAHGLGNFVAFINTDTGQITGSEITPQVWIISVIYIVLFTGYGLYVMRRKAMSAVTA